MALLHVAQLRKPTYSHYAQVNYTSGATHNPLNFRNYLAVGEVAAGNSTTGTARLALAGFFGQVTVLMVKNQETVERFIPQLYTQPGNRFEHLQFLPLGP